MASADPRLQEHLVRIGEAARRLDQLRAAEGAAGNLSVALRDPLDPGGQFPQEEPLALPEPAPELAGATVLVTGSGCRLASCGRDPAANLALLVVEAGGATARLFTSPRRTFRTPTSEFVTHWMLHRDAFAAGADYHAVVHAQPLQLTYLSHIPRYQEEAFFNRRLLRWQPELIFQFPHGIGVVPFDVPGTARLARATLARLRGRTLVVWAKHGVVARSIQAIEQAVDHIEYAEAGASYERLDLACGGLAEGLTVDEMLAICREYGIEQTVFPDPARQLGERPRLPRTIALEIGGPALAFALSLRGRQPPAGRRSLD
ncbi:MAG: hypothetical protein KatS3mg061_3446 [Dehalococcoidia bacterium]|nr:MAG: hypothetical protein KatS3mg061_3446 [Dehalococcoidia bacterium]